MSRVENPRFGKAYSLRSFVQSSETKNAVRKLAAQDDTPLHDGENDSFSATVKCHDENGEL
ncbi:MAG: hypothetical protein A4E35_01935 [Methanoregula sp. PtaU1.Bin051]|nr:MAG: hypothetical protein A4E35_01935 [Methanoregula sp. PtaU1.Bin051]